MIALKETLFNLIAVLFVAISNLPTEDRQATYSKEINDKYHNLARVIITKNIDVEKTINDDKKRIDSQGFNDIIEECRKTNSFLLYKYVLSELDILIDVKDIIELYDSRAIINDISSKSFYCLNDNQDITNVIIIPKVPSAQNTIAIHSEEEIIDKGYKTADYFYDNINKIFNNIICIDQSRLNGYTINNVIFKITDNPNKEKLIIGITPCCNNKPNEIMQINKRIDKKSGKQYFSVGKYHNEDLLLKRYNHALIEAKTKNVDIFIGAEMLGTSKMMSVDNLGFNQTFCKQAGKLPSLFITPTHWIDHKNYLMVYKDSGEAIGRQYKQYKFTMDNEYQEDLREIPKEILLLHIPYVGRIAFPICMDFLNSEYRDLLVRQLKVDLLLCPSFTPGVVQFGNAISSVKEFGVRTIWFNSCSAISECLDKPTDIGLISVPVLGPSNISCSETPITPKCYNNCTDTCLFTITIQLKSEGDETCNTVKVEHIFN